MKYVLIFISFFIVSLLSFFVYFSFDWGNEIQCCYDMMRPVVSWLNDSVAEGDGVPEDVVELRERYKNETNGMLPENLFYVKFESGEYIIYSFFWKRVSLVYESSVGGDSGGWWIDDESGAPRVRPVFNGMKISRRRGGE